MIQYFVWHRMNDRLQTQFVQITNSNKPTLDEIKNNLSSAIERYETVSSKVNNKTENSQRSSTFKANLKQTKQETHCIAVTVDHPKQTESNPSFSNQSNLRKLYCGLCSDKSKHESSHNMANCPVYK